MHKLISIKIKAFSYIKELFSEKSFDFTQNIYQFMSKPRNKF